MPLITKPDMEFIWASGGAIVEPSDVKKQTGWTPEVPPHQWENWIQNRQDNYLAHINQRGIPEWDGNTEYEAAGLSYVQGSNGVVYKSVAASGPATTVQDPTTDVSDTYWTVSFASTTQATETVQGIVELATTAEAQTGTDDVRAMTALKVKQAIAQFGTDFLNAAIATVAAAGTINLTTGAPNTSQLAISGTGVTINGFTVAANRFFVVTMTGASNTLVNSASLVTGRGGNIPVVAGDSFLMRSTAANTVEIVGGVFLTDRAMGGGQTLQLITGSRALGVNYTNTTGRPILVIVRVLTNGGSTQFNRLGIQINGGAEYYSAGAAGVGANYSLMAQGVIPPGAVYRANINSADLTDWTELRA